METLKDLYLTIDMWVSIAALVIGITALAWFLVKCHKESKVMHIVDGEAHFYGNVYAGEERPSKRKKSTLSQ